MYLMCLQNIVAVLKCPNIEGIGDSIKYKFSYSVDVQEAHYNS